MNEISGMDKKLTVGRVLAPWPFLIFAFIAVAATIGLWTLLGPAHSLMVAFDGASVAFLIACVPLFRRRPDQMREAAHRNDANRGFLLFIVTAVTVVILVAVGTELAQKGRPDPMGVVLVIGTLCLAWLFSTMVFTLHYAHLFYVRDPEGGDHGGLIFPETKEPDYWDFAYFSSCLAMTFQTSDVNIKSGTYRRVVMFHSLGAFIFNIGIIAFSINILGGS